MTEYIDTKDTGKFLIFTDKIPTDVDMGHATWTPSGIITTVREPSASLKDYAIMHAEPYSGDVSEEWRAIDQVIVTEIEEWEWKGYYTDLTNLRRLRRESK